MLNNKETAKAAINPWQEFKRVWGVDGMPQDKQRLAKAAWEAGLACREDVYRSPVLRPIYYGEDS